MIYSLWYRRYAPFAEFGGGFEGDHRTSSSTSMSATARTCGGVSFGPGHVGPGTGSSSGTRFTGAGPAMAARLGSHMSKVTSSVTVATRSIGVVRFTAQTAGANPMVPGAPDIDTFVDVGAFFRTRELVIEGRVRGDDFPNAEVFVYDAVGQSRMLWDFATTGGQNSGPATRLAGSHDTQVLGSFFVRIPTDRSGGFV